MLRVRENILKYFAVKIFLEVRVEEDSQARLLLSLHHLDFWTDVGLGREADLHCRADQCPGLRALLEREGIQFRSDWDTTIGRGP